jgi:processing peptidase subunit alpha
MQITKLANGIRVASIPHSSHFYALGVFVDAGSQKESKNTKGSSLLLDKMAYSSTTKFMKHDLMRHLEELGGAIQTTPAREHQAYATLIFPKDLQKMTNLLAEITLRPLILLDELNEVKENLKWEINNQQWQHQTVFPNYLHSLAYRANNNPETIMNFTPFQTNTLGNPLILNIEDLDLITPESLHKFHKEHFIPHNIVVCGVGMSHSDLVKNVENNFSFHSRDTQTIHEPPKLVKYTGGTRILDTTHMPISPNPDDMHLTHAAVTFEAMPISDPDIFALQTITSLLGGGGSFSAGGPGKGMYSR